MRVQRALARAGVASRRRAEVLIAEGRVSVNGRPAAVGQVVDPATDTIAVDGAPVQLGPALVPVWIVLNKPPGYVTTRRDPRGRRTVFELVADRPGLTYAGRLDYMTEGVLLLTTDGTAAHALTHPSRGVERTYVATVRGNAPAAARAARRGVELEDGPVQLRSAVAQPAPDRPRRWLVEVVLTEGRQHEVRRLCAALGLEVERLVRTAFGPVRLGTLAPGATRPLTRREAELLAAIAGSDPPPHASLHPIQSSHGRHGAR